MEVRPGYKQTAVGVIPETWDVPHLRLHLLQDATYGVVKAGTFQRVGIPMIRGGDIKDGAIGDDQPLITKEKSNEYARTVLRERDVLIALVGYPGESAVVPARLAGANISRAVGLLRPAKTLLPEFLACYLNSPAGRKEFLRPSAGSAQIVVNLGALNHLRLPLPSVTEQRAIAGALSDVDALLGGLDRLIAKKLDLKQAVMTQLLTGQTRLPGFSEAWEMKRFGALVDRVFPKSVISSGDGLDLGAYPLFVSGGEPKRIDIAQFRELETLVFSDGGVFAVRHAAGNYSVTDHCYVLTLNPATSDMRWFAAWFSLHSQQMDRLTFKGSGLRNLDKPSLQGIEVHAPERAEQSAIADVLSDMDSELASLEARRDKTRDLKQAMMQELLTGRTRLV